MKAYIVSLGCPKNLTDSEVLMGRMANQGYEITLNPAMADTIVVNTCAFLKSARKESEKTIKEMAAWKKKGKCKELYIAGCLPKYIEKNKSKVKLLHTDGFVDSTGIFNCEAPRIKATNSWYAYVKISEGCNNKCSYCLIPSIRGSLRSRNIADIVEEVKNLANRGVKEIIYVAQDTTAHPDFALLLGETAKIDELKWIRVMYCHPNHLSDKIIDCMASEEKIVKYVDMPIQHISDKILRLMNRKYDSSLVKNIIMKLQKRIPGIAIRTSLIVGFPGETEENFIELSDFIKSVKFDRLGVFAYSREDGSPASKMACQVPEKIKKQRIGKLMRIQAKISKEKNTALIGKKLESIIEKENRSHYIGRSCLDAPEIDGSVFVKKAGPLKIGDFVSVKIEKADTYDLFGQAVLK